ncbi:DUF5723 family protein [Wenyingzhuangia sp. 1_MG-2023]|nr:DUF5723 family protein [Wenyingzhuangia sp. 1_MG-2023]
MKYILYLFFLFPNFTYSQNTIISTDNYSGVLGVLVNPAHSANTPYKLDINLFSNSSVFTNNVTNIDYAAIVKDVNVGFKDFELLSKSNNSNINSFLKDLGFGDFESYLYNFNATKNSFGYLNSTTLGPSFLLAINPRSSFSFASALRVQGLTYNLNGYFLSKDNTIGSIDDFLDFQKNNFRGYGQTFSWGELGLSYATIIRHDYDKLWKFGLTLKFLKGIKTFSFAMNDFQSTLNYYIPNPLQSTLDVFGVITVQNSSNGANYGQALDFGFTFEKNRKHYHSFYKDKSNNIHLNTVAYQYKLSFSVTDLGFINFNNVRKKNNLVDFTLPNNTINYYSYLTIDKEQKHEKVSYILPTTIHLNFDYNLGKHFFMNTNLDYFPLNGKKLEYIKSISNFSFSTRFETLKFTCSSYLNYDSFGSLTTGLYLRTGYFFMNSSFILDSKRFNMNQDQISLGFKIPFYQ